MLLRRLRQGPQPVLAYALYFPTITAHLGAALLQRAFHPFADGVFASMAGRAERCRTSEASTKHCHGEEGAEGERDAPAL